MGQDVEAGAHLALIKHALGCYLRYFAGRPHGACDQAHLRELLQRLDHHQERAHSDGFGQRRALLSQLLEEIASYQPSSPSERANYLALLANQQFLLFQRHTTTVSRASRRPALIQRIVSNLRSIASELRSLEGVTPNATKNLELIEGHQVRFEAEATEIASERENTSPSQLAIVLATAVNVEYAAYQKDFQGRDRSLVDLDKLAGICDRLGEVVYQLVEVIPALTDERDRALAVDNVRIASVHLSQFEVEHNVIAEQRKRFISLAHVVESAAALREQLMAADASEQVRSQAVAHLDALLSDPVVREIVDQSARR